VSRSLTTGQLTKLYAATQDDPLLSLLTVTHDDITTIRRVIGHADVTSRSNVYTAAAFDLVLPDESEERPPLGRIVIDFVDQSITASLLAINTPPSVLIELVFASALDTVVASWPMLCPVARWDLYQCELELAADPTLEEQFPGFSYAPGTFPGLFAR